jgi:uncharacterized protein (DUF983 family)
MTRGATVNRTVRKVFVRRTFTQSLAVLCPKCGGTCELQENPEGALFSNRITVLVSCRECKYELGRGERPASEYDWAYELEDA